MEYLVLKLIHIISSTVIFGTGVGSAFYMFVANRTKNISNIYFATKYVVIADWIFTTPAVLIQLVTGIRLIEITEHSFTDSWVVWALALYFFAGACWLPVVWMQIVMRDLAKDAMENGKELPRRYWKFDMWWIILGSLAFPAVMVIFYLMVFKP